MIRFEIKNPKNQSEGYVLSTRRGLDNKMSIYIERLDGEGGAFDNSDFYNVINKFYKDNF